VLEHGGGSEERQMVLHLTRQMFGREEFDDGRVGPVELLLARSTSDASRAMWVAGNTPAGQPSVWSYRWSNASGVTPALVDRDVHKSLLSVRQLR
jgi:hypothetical protein